MLEHKISNTEKQEEQFVDLWLLNYNFGKRIHKWKFGYEEYWLVIIFTRTVVYWLLDWISRGKTGDSLVIIEVILEK